MDERYALLNPELKMLLFCVERSCGLIVGGGEVFSYLKTKDISSVRHIFAYIAIIHLEYTHAQVKKFLEIKYDSNVNYALTKVPELIKYRPAYRNRIYNIAIEMGIMGLIYHIIRVIDKDKYVFLKDIDYYSQHRDS